MAVDLIQIEKFLLTGSWESSVLEDANTVTGIARSVVDGRYRDAFTSQPAKSFLQSKAVDSRIRDRPLGDALQLEQTLDRGGDETENELLRLSLAIASLHAFVQVNWTGPEFDILPSEVLLSADSGPSPTLITEDVLNAKAISELSYAGEPAYHLTKAATFLRLAQLLLALPYVHCKTAAWWNLRATLVHQQILDEPSSLPDTLLSSLDEAANIYASDGELMGRLLLEKGLVEHQLSQDKSAADLFFQAAKATGMKFELTGALGKRTKFQETDLSQLVLLAESSLPSGSDTGASSTVHPTSSTQPDQQKNVPETLLLNDDTLLEQTAFTKSEPSNIGGLRDHIDPSSQLPLHPLDQCILLALCLNVKNTSPSHGLTNEQMAPYISRVISHPLNWSVHTMALLLRSRLEASRTRTVERSTLQLQALIDQMPTADSTIPERLRYFHSIALPSKWEMERELALRFISIGVTKSALEIFERLEMWEEVVNCYKSLDRRDRAIEIVRDLLEGRKAEAETVLARGKMQATAGGERRRLVLDTMREAKLWCLLGDLEPESAVAHYEHAWTVSKETSGRAMRSLGGYYFARAEYAKAVDCLKRAVAINPLLTKSWFILGCAAMRIEDWEQARVAFSRCVALDEEDGESWNNLASMYLRLGTSTKKATKNDESSTASREENTTSMAYGDEFSKSIPFSSKMLAFRALKQGLRFSYENWRMWYNYMVVAMDVGELSEAARALGRVVEERAKKEGAKSVDEDVLERLVDAVTRVPFKTEDMPGEENTEVRSPNEGHGLIRNVSYLFEHIIMPRVSSPRIFRAYARLLTWQSRWEEVLKAYLDGYRCGSAGTFEKGAADIVQWREAVVEAQDIVDVLRNYGPRVEGSKWKLQARSIVRTFIGRAKDFEDEPEWSSLSDLQDELRKEE